MKKVVVKKEFWSHLRFDNENTTKIKTNIMFTKSQFDKVTFGYAPDDIASRYLAYYENNILYIHDLMSGDCYYELKFHEDTDFAFCLEIKKYTKFWSTHTERETINFVRSFLTYSIFTNPA